MSTENICNEFIKLNPSSEGNVDTLCDAVKDKLSERRPADLKNHVKEKCLKIGAVMLKRKATSGTFPNCKELKKKIVELDNNWAEIS